MTKKHVALVLFILVLSSTGSTLKDPTTTSALSIKAVTSQLEIKSSFDQVYSFLSKNKNFTSGYERDICYNITPDFIANHSDYSIFKYGSSLRSFLLFDDEIYELSGDVGGGLTSMALGDLDEDNQYELYFTFSWGSGLLHSQIGYFNPSTKKVTVFDNQFINFNMILTTNDTETSLFVNEATIKGVSNVDFIVKSKKLVATIVSGKDSINIKVIEN